MKKSVLFMLGISLLFLTACNNEPKKEVKNKSLSTSIKSTTKEASSRTEEKVSSSTSESSSTVNSSNNEEQESEVRLNDFVGGWGVPQSDNLFFINTDGTYSNNKEDHSPLINLSFGTLSDGRKTMSSNIGNIIKELDGTLTIDELLFHPLEFDTKEAFLENKQNEYKNSHEVNVPENEVEINDTTEYITNENISTDTSTLTGFLNVYGMTPAAYKVNIEGMSQEEALRNTPKEMKTSAEIQIGISEYGIK
ncbi:TPA: DUF4950 domain-containing protein [Enterococcus faecalis]